jgi:glutathione S-transferase
LDKATSRAFIRMAEDHMYFHLLLDRWGNEAVWPSIRDTYFKTVPSLVRGFISGRIRKELMHGLHAQGVGRFSEKDRMERIELDFIAIATRLGQGPYLFGHEPSAADCSVGPILGAMSETPVQTDLNRRVAEDPVLSAYAARVAALLG